MLLDAFGYCFIKTVKIGSDFGPLFQIQIKSNHKSNIFLKNAKVILILVYSLISNILNYYVSCWFLIIYSILLLLHIFQK